MKRDRPERREQRYELEGIVRTEEHHVTPRWSRILKQAPWANRGHSSRNTALLLLLIRRLPRAQPPPQHSMIAPPCQCQGCYRRVRSRGAPHTRCQFHGTRLALRAGRFREPAVKCEYVRTLAHGKREGVLHPDVHHAGTRNEFIGCARSAAGIRSSRKASVYEECEVAVGVLVCGVERVRESEPSTKGCRQ